VSPSPSPQPRSEAEQIVLLTKELEWSRLKIQALEQRLRLEMIRKYGPKSEKLIDKSRWIDPFGHLPRQASSRRLRCMVGARPKNYAFR
jgi:hypothetical protein